MIYRRSSDPKLPIDLSPRYPVGDKPPDQRPVLIEITHPNLSGWPLSTVARTRLRALSSIPRAAVRRDGDGAELRIRAAGFFARKTVEDFDFDANPPCARRSDLRRVLDRSPQHRAARTARHRQDPLQTAIALGIAAARQEHRVLFTTATDWVPRLTDAHRTGRLLPELAKLRRQG